MAQSGGKGSGLVPQVQEGSRAGRRGGRKEEEKREWEREKGLVPVGCEVKEENSGRPNDLSVKQLETGLKGDKRVS